MISMSVGSVPVWDLSVAGVLFILFIVCDWMNLVVCSFRAWCESPTFMMLLISSPVRPTSICSVVATFPSGFSRPLPFILGLFCCVFSQVVGIGLRPSLIRLVLHALWSLGCSPLQFIHLSFSSGGWSSMSWDFELHSVHLGCLQLDVWCKNILHLEHWNNRGLSSYGVMVQLRLNNLSHAVSKRLSLSCLLVRSMTMDANSLAHMVSSFPSHRGTCHCFMLLYPWRYVQSSSWIRSMNMGSLFPHHVRTLFILTR